MTALVWALLVITAATAVADWVAVGRNIRWLEYVTKPGFMAGLILLAVALHPANPAERVFFIVALAFGLISDAFLMLPTDMFLAGLVAALVEHLVYISGFRTRELHVTLLIVAAIIALASVAVFLPPIYRAVQARQRSLSLPVLMYVIVFVLMVSSAGGTGSLVALAGALLFFYSDAVLAWNRFVRPLPAGRVVNIVPYHLGQAFLVLSLLA
ncbi:MAG TPA: lysoplasmalogenase [Candidatus Dormibacteraeota bacterium]|nr:lysoplasmalogenase [Candidatus Dormibacteraeota bacterium]